MHFKKLMNFKVKICKSLGESRTHNFQISSWCIILLRYTLLDNKIVKWQVC